LSNLGHGRRNNQTTAWDFFVNDLAGYAVPPRQEVIFLDETNPISSPTKANIRGRRQRDLQR
jgi:hypothetical protein